MTTIAQQASLARAVARALVLAAFFAATAAHTAPPATAAPGYADRPDVTVFIDEMVAGYGFDARALRRFFAKVRYQQSVVNAMSRPVLAPPKWYEYAPQFLSSARIDGGVAFWRAHAAALARAQNEFGVPAEVVVAIIGVETFYGRNTGSYRVADALTTLAFDYPRRAEYFKNELKHFLLQTRERKISPLEPRGSYAGAQGLPQFMPGSFRNFAVDFDNDGRIDLAGDVDDAVGSVANYLAKHGWQTGDPSWSRRRSRSAVRMTSRRARWRHLRPADAGVLAGRGRQCRGVPERSAGTRWVY
jgi:membrane-bound lytic murein transglycosylase B